MTEPPNPFSREGDAWPTYPTAPTPFGYDRSEIPEYQAGLRADTYAAPPRPADGIPPYGTSPYGPSAYLGSPYGYTPTTHPQAVPSLVLGIIGLMICPWVGIAAFVVGRKARNEITAQPQRYAGLGLATAGWCLGIVGIVWAVLVTLFFVLGFAGVYDS